LIIDYKTKLNRLEIRARNSYTVNEVYKKDLNSFEITNFLKSQKKIPIKNIINVIKISKDNNLPIGYVMKSVNSNDIVGFVGTLFSQKKNQEPVCNIHSWIVHPLHRLYSFFLISKLLKKKALLTALTPVVSLKGLLTKLGFRKKIIYEKFLLNLIPFSLRQNRFEIIKINNQNNLIEIELMNKTLNENILLAGSISIKKKIKVFKLLSVNKINIFQENFSEIINLISSQFNLFFFSEYILDESRNFTPIKNILSFRKKREIFLKPGFIIDKNDLFYSDLAF
tara:strand:- start:634 stop:1479 length:846 start_codon:yes stop_codon:yes gene_type:complete